MANSEYGRQRTGHRSQFPSFCPVGPGDQTKVVKLAASTSVHRDISPAQKDALKENLKVLMQPENKAF